MIDWIPVSRRLPDDRREVLVWGRVPNGPQAVGGSLSLFLGVSRCNIGQGSHCFDVERTVIFRNDKTVTHWAEITPPDGGSGRQR